MCFQKSSETRRRLLDEVMTLDSPMGNRNLKYNINRLKKCLGVKQGANKMKQTKVWHKVVFLV